MTMTSKPQHSFQVRDLMNNTDSSDLLVIPYEVIDQFIQYGIKSCIVYSSQIGASLILLVTLLISTRPEKRRSAFFILNMITLAIDFIRNVLLCLYFTGPWYQTEVQFGNNYELVPRSASNVSIAADIFNLFLSTCVQAALILQVWAVCGALPTPRKYLLIVATALLAMLAIGSPFAVVILQSKAILDATAFVSHTWLLELSTYSMVASICFCSAIFTGKLCVAVLQRRRLGMQQFGPMQILFIVGCQTLFIPALISIFQSYIADQVPGFGSMILTLVAIFLPLSSMWAAASTQGNSTTANSSRSSKQAGTASTCSCPDRSCQQRISDITSPTTSISTNAPTLVPAFQLAEDGKYGDDMHIHVKHSLDIVGEEA